jgi:excinuclease ABC subunit C
MVARVARVEAVVCQSRHEAAWLERSMLEHSMPRWNRTAGGQEVPVWLRVSDRGIHVEHRVDAKGELFGPYLGGEQAREAAAALDRVFPLHYAHPRTGADRDMARVLGVLPEDRAPMRAAIVAVLMGDRAAVEATLKALVRRRQASVDAMDFEGAETIQRELEGLTWITEPSRVLEAGPDLDICGWADGVLLTFELRDGRIRDWRTTLCSEQDARTRVASTPDHWRQFATENAELAAALRTPGSRPLSATSPDS